MTTKDDSKSAKGAKKVQSNHAIFAPAKPNRFEHGLFAFDPVKNRGDRRTRPYRAVAKIDKALLEIFQAPAPAGAQLLARRAAFKALRLIIFENTILKENREAAPTTDQAYLAMSASLRQDIEALFRMAKESSPIEKVPSLAEYLEAIKSSKLVVGEPGKPEEGEG